MSESKESIEKKLADILEYIGDDPNREGLLETPSRIRKSWDKLFGGYKQKPEDVLKIFKEGACDEMVILKNVEFYSVCEHHFLPFFGQLHVGYLPNEKVIGISKLARLAEIYARRLQIQERMVAQIADDIVKYLDPKGVMVVAEGVHFCMTSRGVEKQNSIMVTSALRGAFREDAKIRDEFLNLVKGSK